MTPKMKIELRRSEIRSRLGKIADMIGDALTKEITDERDALMVEFDGTEPQLRAAMQAEETELGQRGEQLNGDGETAEIRSLHGKASLATFLTEASSGNALKDGTPESEYRAAMLPPEKAGSGFVPLRLLAPSPVEQRADVATAIGAVDVPAMTASWLDRVFVDTDSRFLGARFESVMSGDALYPVVSDGATAAAGVAGTPTDATEATIEVNSLKPLELRARYLFNRVDSVRLPGLEDALRRDLSMSLGEGLDAMVFNGDGSANEPPGLFNAITAPTAPTAVVTWGEALTQVAAAVDGRYAGDLRDTVTLIGAATFQLMATLLSGVATVDPAAQYLSERTRGFRVSVHVPAAASDVQGAVTARLGRGMGSLVVPVWDALEVTRDPYGTTGAPAGRVALTAVMLYNAAVIRAAAYRRSAFQLA